VNRGIRKYLTAPYDVNGRECTMLAIGCADMTLKTVITTVGITQAGTDSLRPRSKIENGVTKRYNVSVPRPLAIQEMFDSFSAIDDHDHLRQGSLAFHNHWPTKTWWHRLFSTLLGIIITDAFQLYRLDNPPETQIRGGKPIMQFHKFCDKLALELIRYADDDHPRTRGNGIQQPAGQIQVL